MHYDPIPQGKSTVFDAQKQVFKFQAHQRRCTLHIRAQVAQSMQNDAQRETRIEEARKRKDALESAKRRTREEALRRSQQISNRRLELRERAKAHMQSASNEPQVVGPVSLGTSVPHVNAVIPDSLYKRLMHTTTGQLILETQTQVPHLEITRRTNGVSPPPSSPMERSSNRASQRSSRV